MYLYERIFNAIRNWFQPKQARNFTLEVDTLRTLRHAAREARRTPEEMAKDLLDEKLYTLWLREEYLRRWETLSPREQQVAALICLGYTSRQIAARLKIKPDTVTTHADRALAKFGLRDRKTLRQELRDWYFGDWDT